MYDSRIIERRLSNLASGIRQGIDPKFTFRDYSIPEVEEWCARLGSAYDPINETLTRSLSIDEEAFVRHEINRCKVDFLYWATRYSFLKAKDMSLIRLKPTSVQNLTLTRIAGAEFGAVSGKTGDGVLLAVLKSRQLGISTLTDIIIAHRIFFYGNTTALIAADVDTRTPNLYEMVVRVYDNLPWWMKPRSADPKRDYRVKAQLISFADQDSIIRFGSSANMQGGDSGEQKGSIGTGMTLPIVHLSELALWQNPYQINDALMPSIPMTPRTFVVFESTAKGRGNWWHETWERSKRGLGRLQPLFIPWYTDPDTYKLPPPSGWVPSDTALRHAAAVKETSSKWVGRTVNLSHDQLYWWERTRAEYVDGRMLNKFMAEYCISGSTRISTTDGIMPIAGAVAATATETGEISRWWNNGTKKTALVETELGRQLIATPDHRVILAGGEERRIDQLRSGDSLALSAPINPTQYKTLLWQDTPAYQSSTIINELWGRFLGYFMGDGSFYNNRVSIVCDARDLDTVEDVSSTVFKLIGKAPVIEQRKGATILNSQSKEWYSVLHALGCLQKVNTHGLGYKRYVRVPPVIFQSPIQVVLEFLRAVFEADGTAMSAYARSEFAAKDRTFINDVQLLLLMFGINSGVKPSDKVTPTKTYPGFKLGLNATASDLFHTSVGFISERKQSAYQEFPPNGGRPRLPNIMEDRIKTVTQCVDLPVYDLTVGGHMYGANGMLVHNCHDDQSAFQASTVGVFPSELIEDIRNRTAKQPIYVEVKPRMQ